MPIEKGDPAFLYDMLEAAQRVSRYVAGKTQEDFLRDEILRDAVERRIEIIGEAARGVSQAFRENHSEIAWQKITRTRHILAHHYGGIDPEVIWRVATQHVPELIALLSPLIPPGPGETEDENG